MRGARASQFLNTIFYIMEWITLSPEDLEEALNKPQLEKLKAQPLRSDGVDIVGKILESVTSRIRLEISASGLNFLDKNHSKIPPELRDCAARLAVEALTARIPAIEITPSQQKRADDSRSLLLRIASGELPVSVPKFPVASARTKKGTTSSASKRIATRKSMGTIL